MYKSFVILIFLFVASQICFGQEQNIIGYYRIDHAQISINRVHDATFERKRSESLVGTLQDSNGKDVIVHRAPLVFSSDIDIIQIKKDD